MFKNFFSGTAKRLVLPFLVSLLFFPGLVFAERPQVYIASLNDDTINPVTAGYVIKALELAEGRGAECLLIKLDTPGGLLSSTRSLVKRILGASIPVIVYISPSGSRAGSAGVFITYAAHVAAMAPSTNIGAAHPVQAGGGRNPSSVWDAVRDLIDLFVRRYSPSSRDTDGREPGSGDPLSGKILNDTVAFIKAIAKERGRNVEWAEKSVVESASITEKEALEMKVIDVVADYEDDLFAKIHGRTVTVKGSEKMLNTENPVLHPVAMDARERLLNVLANPNIAYMLLILGFYGLLFEVTHPGFGLPGIAGAISLIIALYSMQMLPTNYAGLGLMLLGVFLFAAEVKLTGYGLLALAGLVSMILGSLFLFDSSDAIMRVSYSLVFSLAGTTAILTLLLVRAVVLSHRRKVITGMEGMIGVVGQAEREISPGSEGKVFVHGELWNAVSDELIRKGEKIKVVKCRGMLLCVEKVSGEISESK